MNKLVSWFRGGLARLHVFRRKAEPDTEELASAVLPDTVAQTQPLTDVAVEQGEMRPGGFWSRLRARFSKRAAVADEAEQEDSAGNPESDVAATAQETLPPDGESEGGQPPGFWSRLVARFRKRDAADADEGAAEVLRPDAGHAIGSRQSMDDRAPAKRHARGADEPEEESSRRPGIRDFLARKPVWISLLVLAFAATLFGGWFAAQQWQARGAAAAKVLAQRNQDLAEQNKRLQAENAKLAEERPKLAPAGQREAASASKGAGRAKSSSVSDDCTVQDAASVRDVLKGCIDSFNASSGR